MELVTNLLQRATLRAVVLKSITLNSSLIFNPINQVQAKLGKLEAALAEQNRQQKLLDDEVLDCSNKLKRAEMLISGLGGEKTRWTQIAKNMRDTYNSLTGKHSHASYLHISMFCSDIIMDKGLTLEWTPRT